VRCVTTRSACELRKRSPALRYALRESVHDGWREMVRGTLLHNNILTPFWQTFSRSGIG